MGENADPHKLSELHHKLLEWAIFSPDDVNAFASVWYARKRDHSSADHRRMNALLDGITTEWGRSVMMTSDQPGPWAVRALFRATVPPHSHGTDFPPECIGSSLPRRHDQSAP